MDMGVMEATRIITFRALGFHSALGLTYGIMVRLRQIFWAGVGLLIYATLLIEKQDRGFFFKRRHRMRNETSVRIR
jgi:hypothetical protein